MSDEPSPSRRLIETEALIVAYAMSRLDRAFLDRFGYDTWSAAFDRAASAFDLPATSMKNLRDEFDVVHPHRKGWRNRPMLESRQRVLGEFYEASDDALLEIAARLLAGDSDATDEIVRPLATTKQRVENVAERLRTGRLAEEYFMEHSERLCGVPSASLVDRRQDAAGHDFGASDRPQLAIEVKGLKALAGPILFTDLEWRTARLRRDNYWLVVVGGLDAEPSGRLWRDPASVLRPDTRVRRTAVAEWVARVEVA